MPPRPSRPSSSRVPFPRPHSRVVADLVSSVRECEREVLGSRAWRSLMARLDESEEDFAEEEDAEAAGAEANEEAEQSRRGFNNGGGGGNDGGGARSRRPFAFREVSRLTVLGLGSLEGSRTSRLQAALALLLARERFPRVALLSPKAGAGAAAAAEEEEEEEESRGKKAKDRNHCLFAADPVFTAAYRDALTELGFSVVAPEEAVQAGRARRRRRRRSDDEEGEGEEGGEEEEEEEEGEEGEEEEQDGLSFFYLPHCYPPVAEEVLEAHWNRDDLRRVAILGNSLSSVAEKAERTRRKSSSATTATLETAAPRCVAVGSKSRARAAAATAAASAAASSVIIEASVVGPDLDAASARSGLGAAFNDTSLHLFPRWTKEFAEII